MLRTERDAILSLLWALTYTLVLIGTKKYKYPLISPITQVLIASLEFSVLIQLTIDGWVGSNHVWLSYLFWAIIEIAIITEQIRCGFIPRRYVGSYVLLLAAATGVMCCLVIILEQGLLFNYFNTFVGEIIWLRHIRKKDYPMKPITLMVFIAKFVADSIAITVYFGRGTWFVDLICVTLPVLDYMFIHTYFSRIDDAEKTVANDISKKDRKTSKRVGENENKKH